MISLGSLKYFVKIFDWKVLSHWCEMAIKEHALFSFDGDGLGTVG